MLKVSGNNCYPIFIQEKLLLHFQSLYKNPSTDGELDREPDRERDREPDRERDQEPDRLP
jgi:hypothetical protein